MRGIPGSQNIPCKVHVIITRITCTPEIPAKIIKKEAGNELSSRYFDKKKRDAIVNFCKQRNSNFISDKMHETAFNGYIMNT